MSSRAHLGRIGAEERGRDRHGTARNEGEVERQVMPFDAPGPGRRGLRRAKNGHVVLVGIAEEPAEGLQLAQDFLQLHHVGGFRVTDARERGFHELVPGCSCRRRHVLERQAGASARHVVPVHPLVLAEREHGRLALARLERRDEGRGRARHARAGSVLDLRLHRPAHGEERRRRGDAVKELPATEGGHSPRCYTPRHAEF